MRSAPPPERGVLEALRGRAWRDCIPLHASLEITLRCNLRCVHCYNFDRGGVPPPPAPELGLDETVGLLDDLRAAGCLFLSLTGGEPLLHPRFWDILDAAAARRFSVTLLTNGTLLGERTCGRLARFRNLWQVSLSLYGARPETHDAVTRTRGSFRRLREGLRRLRRRGLPAAIKLVVMKANAREVPAMIAMAEGESLPWLVDASISPRHDGTPGSPECRADLSTIESLYRGPLRRLLQKGDTDPSGDDFKCDCARSNVAVSAAGDVWPCIAAPIRGGNLRERRFREIWEGSPAFRRIRGLRLEDFKACAPCPLKAWCPRNPGTAFLAQGDYTAADPRACAEAEIIRRILGGRGATRPAPRAGRATSPAGRRPGRTCP